MRLQAAIRGDLRQVLAAETKAAERAVTAGVRRATDGLKLALRGQVTSAGLGTRLANTWRGNVYPTAGDSLNAAGFVFSKAAKIIYAFATGVTIRAKGGGYLAIPLPAAGKVGDAREKITPGGWERATGMRLRFVYRRGAASLLVADHARVNTRGRAVGRRSRGQIATRGGATVPIFVLVPQVTLKKRLDVAGAAKTWGDQLPQLVVAAWKDPQQ